MSAHESSHDHGHHVDSVSLYVKTALALTVLMVLTIAASFVHIPIGPGSLLNNVVAIAIATSKAILVIAIFMGVRKGSGLIKLYAIGGFVWFFLFFIMFCDYATRSWEPVRGWYGEDTPTYLEGPRVVVPGRDGGGY